jgi:2-hydroxychromene-2-carboxylate isomerase
LTGAGARLGRTVLELWFDFTCPYAYLASRRAPRLPTAIDSRPMLLDPHLSWGQELIARVLAGRA